MLAEIELEALRYLDRAALEALQMHSRHLRNLVNRHAHSLPVRHIHDVDVSAASAYLVQPVKRSRNTSHI